MMFNGTQVAELFYLVNVSNVSQKGKCGQYVVLNRKFTIEQAYQYF